MFVINENQCPHCAKTVDHLDMRKISLGDRTNGPLFYGVSLYCPHCKKIVTAGFDPYALKEDFIEDGMKALGAKDKRQK